MTFLFRPQTLGGHIHMAVFCADGEAIAQLGTLVVRDGPEWTAFRALLVHAAGGDERPDGSIVLEASAP